jgi:hypothetical protein
MPVQTTNDVINAAFQILSSATLQYYTSRRRCLGAGLKLTLQRTSNFNEHQIGFTKFGDFLRAAERAGIIQLFKTPGGDLEVLPPGARPSQLEFYSQNRPSFALSVWQSQPKQSVVTSNVSSGAIRVRPDLWNAFNSFSSNWVYDRNQDLARKATDGVGYKPQSIGDSALVAIPPGRDRVVDWMRSFADTQDFATKALLLNALQNGVAPHQFKSSVAADHKLQRAWRHYQIQQVVAAIEAWATSNSLHPKNIATAYRRPDPTELKIPVVATQAVAVASTPADQTPASPLTPRLVTLVDELIDELLRLRGTLQVIEAKR